MDGQTFVNGRSGGLTSGVAVVTVKGAIGLANRVGAASTLP